ncbi:NAD(P)/FAD-dependent oxidoreductase, partial [Streptococcus pyogenes]
YVQTNNVENVAVVGAGFIGLEVAENLKHSGYNVSIIEAQNQILTPLDYDMVQTVNSELMEQGVDLYLEEAVTEIIDTELVLD